MPFPLPRRNRSLLRLASGNAAAALVLAAASLGLSGCPGELDPHLLGGGGPTICDGAALLAGPKCGIVGCHNTTAPQGDLDLFSPGVSGRLVGRMPNPASTTTVCGANTTPYLMAGSSPATGLLFDKLKMMPPCGLAMPYPGVELLPANEIACLQEWATAVTTGVITP